MGAGRTQGAVGSVKARVIGRRRAVQGRGAAGVVVGESGLGSAQGNRKVTGRARLLPSRGDNCACVSCPATSSPGSAGASPSPTRTSPRLCDWPWRSAGVYPERSLGWLTAGKPGIDFSIASPATRGRGLTTEKRSRGHSEMGSRDHGMVEFGVQIPMAPLKKPPHVEGFFVAPGNGAERTHRPSARAVRAVGGRSHSPGQEAAGSGRGHWRRWAPSRGCIGSASS